MTRITVNGDDFGMNPRNSSAIAEAFAKGLITDTTMLVDFEYFDEAILLAEKEGFSDKIGIHFNLTEGEPLTEHIRNCPRFVGDNRFNKQYNGHRTSPLTKEEKDAVYEELTAQVRKLRDAGVAITHADSHHHIHTGIFIAPIVSRICRENGIKRIRLHRDLGEISSLKRFVKNRYNTWLRKQGFVTTEHFAYVMDIVNADIPDSTEIMVHPDFDKDGVLIDRRGMENGCPVGYPLPDFVKERNVALRGYTDI